LIRNNISEIRSGNTQSRSAPEAKVIAANVDFYRQVAAKYDSSASYLFDPFLQQGIEEDLDKISSYFVSIGRTPSCLECGGGTGNLTLKMCARGWRVTVVDVSEEMLTTLRAKTLAKGFSPTLITAPIERFLAETNKSYDLVAFSAVLHHLYSYTSVVERAALKVWPGGFFYSNLDPIVPSRLLWARCFDSVDIAFAKLSFDPADVLPGIGRRIRKLFLRPDVMFNRAVFSSGDIAEYHAQSGVDDMQIIHQLQRAGFLMIDHNRYPSGRTRAGRMLNSCIRVLQLFKIIAQRKPEKL
jgi:2-polyprenyl-3-methyl-5-hydroxy-6-metoxy-1,4-benzoquinol methylase